MASLFQGTPQQATSYTTSTSETPKWMQDAVYNQIQMAQNVANRPYEAYSLPTTAELSPLQQQAYQQVQANQGSWSPAMTAAQTGMQNMSGSNAGYTSAQPGLTAQANVLNQLQGQYGKPASTLTPYVQQATGMSGVSAAKPYFDTASAGMQAAGGTDTASGLQSAQNEYLRKDLVDTNLNAGQEYWGRAGQLDAVGAAQPYFNQAAGMSSIGAAQPYLNQASATTAEALSDRALQAANPYLQAASQSSAQNVGSYMNPYTEGVTSQIARLGARNLSENLLPAVSDQFVRAGQFGGSRMGEFGSRALRDTQESVLNQQAQALQSGYGQALGASQADLARQAQLAGTVGSISGADLSRVLQGGAQYGNLGQMAGQLTSAQQNTLTNIGQSTGQLTGQQMQNLSSLGQMQTGAGQAQQQFGLNAAQAVQQAQAQDAARQLSAAQAQAGLGQNMGALTQAQQQNLLSAGQALSGAEATGISQAQAGASQYGQLASTAGQLGGADANRQMSALNQMANMAQQRQGMGIADVAALEGAGQAQQGQQQAQLNAAYNQFKQQQAYPQQQLDWLSTQVRGMAPVTPSTTTQAGSTTGASYSASPLSQLAGGYAAYRGLTS